MLFGRGRQLLLSSGSSVGRGTVPSAVDHCTSKLAHTQLSPSATDLNSNTGTTGHILSSLVTFDFRHILVSRVA